MVVDEKMIDIIEINKICDDIGAPPPKVIEYANCIAVSFRNGDGLKTLVTFESDATAEVIRAKIATAFKIKPGMAASDEKIAAITTPDDPVTPAADIRKHQEAEKLKAAKPAIDDQTE